MKKKNLFLFIILKLAIISTVSGQEISKSNTSWQLNLGMGRTLHYNAPITVVSMSIEGSYTKEQDARLGKNIDLIIHKKINSLNGIIFGLGYSEYRFFDKGLASTGGSGFSNYEEIVVNNYINIHLGHRLIFEKQIKGLIYIENNIITEFPILYYDQMNKFNFAYKVKTGWMYNMSDNYALNINGYFKTAIAKYGIGALGEKYYPYGYGIEFGIIRNL